VRVLRVANTSNVLAVKVAASTKETASMGLSTV
jgi:hypothetical protein